MTNTPDLAMRAVEAAHEINDLLYLYQLATGQMLDSREPIDWWRVAFAAACSAELESEAMSATVLLWELDGQLPSDAPSIASIVAWAVSAAEGRSPSELRPDLRLSLVRTESIEELRVWRRLKNRLALVRRLPESQLTKEAADWLEKWSWIP